MEERLYDLIFICLPATPEEEVAKIIATLEQAVAEHGGKVEKTREVGHAQDGLSRGQTARRLLRRTCRCAAAQGDLIKELERRLKVSDAVIKYQTVRLDEEIKRQQKLVGRRERRARRRPRKPAAAAPAAPGAAPPARQRSRAAAAAAQPRGPVSVYRDSERGEI